MANSFKEKKALEKNAVKILSWFHSEGTAIYITADYLVTKTKFNKDDTDSLSLAKNHLQALFKKLKLFTHSYLLSLLYTLYTLETGEIPSEIFDKDYLNNKKFINDKKVLKPIDPNVVKASKKVFKAVVKSKNYLTVENRNQIYNLLIDLSSAVLHAYNF